MMDDRGDNVVREADCEVKGREESSDAEGCRVRTQPKSQKSVATAGHQPAKAYLEC